MILVSSFIAGVNYAQLVKAMSFSFLYHEVITRTHFKCWDLAESYALDIFTFEMLIDILVETGSETGVLIDWKDEAVLFCLHFFSEYRSEDIGR